MAAAFSEKKGSSHSSIFFSEKHETQPNQPSLSLQKKDHQVEMFVEIKWGYGNYNKDHT